MLLCSRPLCQADNASSTQGGETKSACLVLIAGKAFFRPASYPTEGLAVHLRVAADNEFGGLNRSLKN